MGFDPIPTLYTGLVCHDCGITFDAVTTVGPIGICDPCARKRIDAIFAMTTDDFDALPVPGDRVTCGLRKDLPKKARRHSWIDLGTDTRHVNNGDFIDMNIFACVECGRDRMKRIRV